MANNTLVISLDQDIADYIDGLQGTVDPSELINGLFHKEMQKKNFHPSREEKKQTRNAEAEELRLLSDLENTAAAE